MSEFGCQTEESRTDEDDPKALSSSPKGIRVGNFLIKTRKRSLPRSMDHGPVVFLCKMSQGKRVSRTQVQLQREVPLMTRLARVVALGVPHHVTQRGNARRFILDGDVERRAYLDLLRAYPVTACTRHRKSSSSRNLSRKRYGRGGLTALWLNSQPQALPRLSWSRRAANISNFEVTGTATFRACAIHAVFHAEASIPQPTHLLTAKQPGIL